MPRHLPRFVFTFVAAALIGVMGVASFARAQADDGLLPVEDAFRLTAKIVEPGKVALHWDIAPDYYLYRARIKAKTSQGGATLGDLALPNGTKKHDEFLGDVEVYHKAIDATLPYTLADAAATTLAVTITVQGCHEVDPKICYPPHATALALDVHSIVAAGAAPAASPSAANAAAGTETGATEAAPADGAGAPLSLASKLGVTAATEPLPPDQAFVFEAIAASPTSILARWTMPKGYYLYRDKSSITLADGDGVALGTPRWPKGVDHSDEHFGTTVVYFDEVELPIPLARERGAAQKIELDAEYQGCQEDGICYPVMTKTVSVEMPQATAQELAAAKASFVPAPPSPALRAASPASGTGESRGEVTSALPATTRAGATNANTAGQSEEQAIAANLSSNRWLALLSFFGFGLLLAFTPCVFPMIPILSGIIAGSGENISTRRAFVLSIVYVLATCVVFTIAGVVAGLAGANLQAAFQKPWILWSFATLFVLLSLSMFGFYELQLPGSWQTKIADISNQQKGGSLIGVAIMGLLSALIVGPCVAPPLAAAVLYISQTRDPVFGGLALFVLSLGMGAPLVVFGTAAGKLLPRAGAWMDAVKAVFGVLFLGLAIWMLARVLDAFWIMLMTGALAIASAVYLGALERLPEGASAWRRLWKALGIVLLVAGAAEILGAASGARDVTQPLAGIVARGGKSGETNALAFRTVKSVDDLDRLLADARQAHQPVMLDFYADWCVSCKEMDKFTFSQPAVQSALAGFVVLRVDVTANDGADQALLKRFGLFGPPATIFFADGAEKRALRLIGFEKADDFAARAGKAR